MRSSGPRTTSANGIASIGVFESPEASPVMLIGRLDAARLCGVSPASWDRLTAAGKTPVAIRLGGRVLWRRTDLEVWIVHGCPDRKTFAVLIAK
jgi:predicted DNA-binding transcriptional regulator AlpA